MSELPIQRVEAMPVAKPQPTAADMLQAVISSGVTQENVAAVKEIVLLMRDERKLDSEREFARAFNALQSEMPKVQAKKAVPNNDGSVRYKFAPYEEIMDQVAPFLVKHGFTVTFSNRMEDGRTIVECELQHAGGHLKKNQFSARIGKGPPGSSDAQADGAASTYAKRFALANMLNIRIETDSDARAEGDLITKEQAADLRRRVGETGSNEAAFLKFGGVTPSQPPCLADYEKIRSAKYALLDENLRRKEKVS